MKNFLNKPFRWAIIFSILLTTSFSYVMLDTFVFTKAISVVATTTSSSNAVLAGSSSDTSAQSITTTTTTAATVTANSYKDDNISITIETVREYNTTFYVADIQVSDVSYLKTAFANNTYGKNIKATTSAIASANNAIFAINGDYYGFRTSGYVLRNGVLYRETANGSTDALVIGRDGDFSIVTEGSVTAKSLSDSWQILSFGPALIKNGAVSVTSSSEVAQSMTSNPRTAIGVVSPLHYIVIVSDGRTSASTGLSLLQLANEFKERNCTTAYNLDGGGSSTMYFNGKIVNNPTNGSSSGERQVSDIVYIGY